MEYFLVILIKCFNMKPIRHWIVDCVRRCMPYRNWFWINGEVIAFLCVHFINKWICIMCIHPCNERNRLYYVHTSDCRPSRKHLTIVENFIDWKSIFIFIYFVRTGMDSMEISLVALESIYPSVWKVQHSNYMHISEFWAFYVIISFIKWIRLWMNPKLPTIRHTKCHLEALIVCLWIELFLLLAILLHIHKWFHSICLLQFTDNWQFSQSFGQFYVSMQ